jgi:Patatin-like phospholipase
MPGSPSTPTASAAYSAERHRAQQRRTELGVRRPDGQEHAQWALALSGGGIRSATFCLGVLQGLARTPGPSGSNPALPLLYHFDYLSTVSGGGYIGSFLSSLYVPGRLSGDPGESNAEAAQRVARVLQEDPPGRVHQAERYDPSRPGRTALAWLRDNGRYLAPSGAGDYLYGVALALRNWVATQYVMGTAICLTLAFIALLRWGAIVKFPAFADYERSMLAEAMQMQGIWWSTLWWLCLPVLLLVVIPLGIGFWFSYGDGRAADSDAASPFNKAVGFALGIGAVFAVLGWLADPGPGLHNPVCVAAVATGVMLWIACFWHGVSYRRLRSAGAGVSVTAQRVVMTRWLTISLGASLLIGSVATIDSLSQTVRLNVESWVPRLLGSGTGLGVIVWIGRALVESRSEKESPSWLARIPVSVLATGGGVILWILAATGWHVLLQALIWCGKDLQPDAYVEDSCSILLHAAIVFVVCFSLAWVVGYFRGFLNLSTLQGLYSARLTRSYLGASNHARFAHDHPASRSVAEPTKNDGLALRDIYRNTMAPMHLINVCVNQTVDPAEQLVQRDRKGKPLVVAPDGFYLDGQPHSFGGGASRVASEVAKPLTLGEWIGVSGAALTTGLGRSTGFGMSLLLGFANVRLGRWWPSGVLDPRPRQGLGRLLRNLFGTQAYLLDEMTGSFYGTRREYQYLSDGGHFENTAVYELLRSERDIRLIVACDCGCDPNYGFRDLANLIRLARIDHGLELRVNEDIAKDAKLGAVFGRPDDLSSDDTDARGAGRCALLIDVIRPSPADQSEQVVARIIVLKPRLIQSAPLDLANYQSQHAAFPQEPTGDQFYDEAQWESYRKLGLEIALRVFPSDAESASAQDFWRKVMT